MQSYVVRVYDRPASADDRVVGLVERIDRGDVIAFQGLDQLLAILAESAAPSGGARSPRQTPRGEKKEQS